MMPALLRGIVVVWKVKTVGDKQVVCYVTDGPVSLFTDGGPASDGQAIIAEFILQADKNNREGLLEASRDGLLQVHDIQRTALTPPPLPSRCDAIQPATPANPPATPADPPVRPPAPTK
jgi:hypothetical protein